MGKIKFRWFYTELVEHYMRMAVRYKTVSKASSQYWFTLTNNWIDSLCKDDKEFVCFIFSSQFYNTFEGLYCFPSKDDMELKRKRLAVLEKRFAIDAGLISGNDDEIKMGENAY